MLAVERFPSLTDALDRDLEQPERMNIDGPVAATSISDPQGTAMAVHTLRASAGDAVSCDDREIRTAWTRLAARGVLRELSSAAALHGATVLAERGALHDDSTVVLLATAGPYAQQSLDGQVVGRRVDDPADAGALQAAVAGSPLEKGER